jgi:uncharacterized protein (TIGR03437 family)
MKTKTTLLVVLLLTACVWSCFAQAFDSSGDSKLNGAYYFRQVFYFSQTGDAINVQGTITFNGTGGYNITNASLLDSASGSTTPVTFTNQTGSYAISASGEGFITAVNADFPNDQIVGLVSQNGVFIGSTTETSNLYNDLFIAAPIGSTATNATLNGAYTAAYFDPTFAGDALFTMNANGSGNIGNVSVTGYVATNSDPTASTPSTETISGVTYSFSNGAAQINFGGNPANNLIAGTELLYISPDGNFLFGGSYNGFDMFVGVRAAATSPSNVDFLYYQAGVDLIEQSSGNLLDSYYGSLQSFSKGNVIGHQRVNSLQEYGGSSDFTYYDFLSLGTQPDGSPLTDGSTLSDFTFSQNYAISSDATVRIGYGIGPDLGINVAFQAPAFNGSGVYLSPVGVVNAASSAPFTALVSPGEFLTLYGSGLATTTNSAGVPFPTKLNGVQVLINQVAAPIYYVSPTQISVIVPYGTAAESVAQIQVVNNGANSNIVTAFTGETSVGAFTNNPVGGIGIVAAERPDFSIVSESNPAQSGETIAAYVAGMGAVDPTVADGSAAPSSTLSNTTATPAVFITDSAGNFAQATIAFSGLAPGFAGLYQINFAIPTGLASGDASIEIDSGVDSDSLEALLPLSGTSSAARPDAKNAHPRVRRHQNHQKASSVNRFGANRRPAASRPRSDCDPKSDPVSRG